MELNLQQIKQETFDLTMVDGEVLNLMKPTQSMINTLLEISKKTQIENMDMKIIEEVYSFLLRILNRNMQGKTYKKPQVEDVITLDLAMMIVEKYIEWSFGLLKSPN